MDKNFTDILTTIDNKWAWRKDDTNLVTFKILSEETELIEKVKPYLKNTLTSAKQAATLRFNTASDTV